MSDLEPPVGDQTKAEADFLAGIEMDDFDDVTPPRRAGIVMGNPILLVLVLVGAGFVLYKSAMRASFYFQEESIGYLLGFVKTRPNSAFQYEKTTLHIDQVAVIQSFQKRGVGQLLMNEAYRLAELKQIKEIQLDFWAGNDLAENFFSRNDFNFFNHRMNKRI